ncbi:hypothetical protein G7Y89_g15667 [Cudoniella acicularis]|uniref:Uncharacterized protein n=1 Tax=Cudoniella acicularis TaxID=354080 RepID=A0A8H4QIF1_9HELO|nr:hypothetical protein G7Y89_g15667 [Cudoniella acicularis]
MEPAATMPNFELMKRDPTETEGTHESFNPSSHDIIYIANDGSPRIGRNASPNQMINILKASNQRYSSSRHGSTEPFASPLIVVRFEEQNPVDDVLHPTTDWNTLWPHFDSCCNPNAEALDFVLSIRQREPHCNSCILPNAPSRGSSSPKCRRISYNLDFGGKHILLIHHFHDVDGECLEMMRMMTYGLPEDKVAIILDKAISYVQEESCAARHIPHPKIILCSMLECVESWCRKTLRGDRKYLIEKLETQIRNADISTPKGLQIQYIELNDAMIDLTEVKRKLERGGRSS